MLLPILGGVVYAWAWFSLGWFLAVKAAPTLDVFLREKSAQRRGTVYVKATDVY